MTSPFRFDGTGEPETEEERRKRLLREAMRAADLGIPFATPNQAQLPPVTITGKAAHPWVESMTRAQNPELFANQPELPKQLTMRDLARPRPKPLGGGK